MYIGSCTIARGREKKGLGKSCSPVQSRSRQEGKKELPVSACAGFASRVHSASRARAPAHPNQLCADSKKRSKFARARTLLRNGQWFSRFEATKRAAARRGAIHAVEVRVNSPLAGCCSCALVWAAACAFRWDARAGSRDRNTRVALRLVDRTYASSLARVARCRSASSRSPALARSLAPSEFVW